MKNVLFKRKTIPIEVNFLLREKYHFEFNQFEKCFVNFPQKILMRGGGTENCRDFEISGLAISGKNSDVKTLIHASYSDSLNCLELNFKNHSVKKKCLIHGVAK